MRKKSLLWWSLGLLAIYAIWKLAHQSPLPEPKLKSSPQSAITKKSPASYLSDRAGLPGQPAIEPAVPLVAQPGERSALADQLNAPDQPIQTDLSIVYNLLSEYRTAFGDFPTGEDNAQIVNALSGNNRKKLAFLNRDSSAINTKGELIDRWNTPFFFHLISSQEIQIRSAGPDREFYTPDDAVRAR